MNKYHNKITVHKVIIAFLLSCTFLTSCARVPTSMSVVDNKESTEIAELRQKMEQMEQMEQYLVDGNRKLKEIMDLSLHYVIPGAIGALVICFFGIGYNIFADFKKRRN